MSTLQRSQLTTGCFGKIPSRGDFIRSHHHDVLSRMLDRWLSLGLELASTDPRWKEHYDKTAPCQFAFVGVRNKVAIVGHLQASTDSAGRRFPFATAGSFDVDDGLAFMKIAPLAMMPAWSRLSTLGAAADETRGACEAIDMDIDVRPSAWRSVFMPFVESHTVGTLDALLCADHPATNLRRTLLGLGLLLCPVRDSGCGVAKGVCLPLPEDDRQAALVGSLWLHLVAPFLERGDFEVALYVVPARGSDGPALYIGMSGASPAMLQALFNFERRFEAVEELICADWVDSHVHSRPEIRKLASHLTLPDLSLQQAMRSFTECFLGP